MSPKIREQHNLSLLPNEKPQGDSTGHSALTVTDSVPHCMLKITRFKQKTSLFISTTAARWVPESVNHRASGRTGPTSPAPPRSAGLRVTPHTLTPRTRNRARIGQQLERNEGETGKLETNNSVTYSMTYSTGYYYLRLSRSQVDAHPTAHARTLRKLPAYILMLLTTFAILNQRL